MKAKMGTLCRVEAEARAIAGDVAKLVLGGKLQDGWDGFIDSLIFNFVLCSFEFDRGMWWLMCFE